jgi:hypothetical protein
LRRCGISARNINLHLRTVEKGRLGMPLLGATGHQQEGEIEPGSLGIARVIEGGINAHLRKVTVHHQTVNEIIESRHHVDRV